ncbi:carboxylic ester hydrolase [Lysinibacillus pakistanensis]|uniref:alpha/beta hydrolase family protein n=1 Tax=Lysinibacillus pakistanensis TaxID=759811 RepID=UPI003D2BC3C7
MNIILLICAGMITGLHMLIEGYRWQILPAYLLLLLPCIQFLFFWKNNISTSWLTRVVKGFFYILWLYVVFELPIIAPMFSFPEPTGPYKIGTTSLHLVDEKRLEEYTKEPDDHRELMIQIWYPAEVNKNELTAPYTTHSKELAAGLQTALPLPQFALQHLNKIQTHSYQDAQLVKNESGWPVLLFSHGMNLYRYQNTFQVEELVSHGYIVVGIDHTYDAAATVFPDGRTVLNSPQLDDGIPALDKHIAVWTDDVTFVLDQLEKFNQIKNEELYHSMDMKKIGMFGHSYGGATAMQMLLRDDRVKASINMDGGLFGDDAPKQGVGKPFLMMNADEMEKYMTEAKNSEKNDLATTLFKEFDRRQTLALRGGGYSLTIPNTNHASFTDTSLFSKLLQSKGEDAQDVHQIINEVSLEFFNQYVKDDAAASMKKIADRYPKIQLTKNK